MNRQELLELWSQWELRGMVLLSLFLQVTLVLFGSLRKYTPPRRYKLLIRFLIWSAYLCADLVATAALGYLARRPQSLSSKGGRKENSRSSSMDRDALHVIWAPLLLMHLGGSDTISAYALEDNELWLRQLVSFMIQASLAGYVFMQSWGISLITYLCIPLFISGIIKYAERTWALKSASSTNIQNSLSPGNDPLRKNLRPLFDRHIMMQQDMSLYAKSIRERIFDIDMFPQDAKILYESYFTFLMLAGQLGSTILTAAEMVGMLQLALTLKTEEVIQVVENELGFMYDVFFTKALRVYSKLGITFRIIYLVCSILVVVGFPLVDAHEHTSADKVITYVLLVGAAFLDIYSFLLLIFSDWTRLWLTKHKNLPLACKLYQIATRCTYKKKWSKSMAQHNLLKLCLKEVNARLPQCFGIDEMARKYLYINWEDVDEEFLVWIFNLLKSKRQDLERRRVFRSKDFILCPDEFSWTIQDGGFDQTLLVWHIATEICYQNDLKVPVDRDQDAEKRRRESKCLSEYMLYLLVECPLLLPKGIGDLNFKLTCSEVKNHLQRVESRGNAAEKLLEIYGQRRLLDDEHRINQRREQKDGEFLGTVRGGCIVAKELMDKNHDNLWEIMNDMWVEMLSYAACQSDQRQHAQQLGNGGEFLTHVSIFMAHLGMKEESIFHVRAFNT